MRQDTTEARGGWRTGGALLVVGLIAAGIYVGARDWGTDAPPATDARSVVVDKESETAVAPSEVAAAPQVVAAPAAEAEPDMAVALAPEQESDAASVEELAAPEADAPAPSLDVVRVSPDGQSVVAGRAPPGARVTIRADNAPLAEVDTDAAGNFVAVFRAEPTGAARSLTVEAQEDDGAATVGDDVVVLLPGAVTEPEEVVGTTVASTRAPDAADVEAEPEATVAAAAILRDGRIEVRPVARPTGAEADAVSIASISYAEAGDVRLAGFGLAGSELRAYVDDQFAEDGFVDASGRWALDLDDVVEGVYRLRIDQIGGDGAVASRIETPFQRDKPRARPAGAGESDVAVIVQPGNNLWTLARIHYGSGVLYSRIFTANRELIRDPDLIYPGQIFALPEQQAN